MSAYSGPDIHDTCPLCDHTWTQHHNQLGCLHGWEYNEEGTAVTDGCECKLAHVEVLSA